MGCHKFKSCLRQLSFSLKITGCLGCMHLPCIIIPAIVALHVYRHIQLLHCDIIILFGSFLQVFDMTELLLDTATSLLYGLLKLYMHIILYIS